MPCTAATAAVAAAAGAQHGRTQMTAAQRRVMEQLDKEEEAREIKENRRLSTILQSPLQLSSAGNPIRRSASFGATFGIEEVEENPGAPAPEPAEEEARAWYTPIMKCVKPILSFLNNPRLQVVLYVAYVMTFQLLVESMRNSEEFFFDKMCAPCLGPFFLFFPLSRSARETPWRPQGEEHDHRQRLRPGAQHVQRHPPRLRHLRVGQLGALARIPRQRRPMHRDGGTRRAEYARGAARQGVQR